MKFFLLFSLLLGIPAWAGGIIPFIFFPKHQSALVFTTSAQSISTLNCSSVVTLQNVNASSIATNVSGALTINLTGSTGVTFYSDVNCTSAVTSVTIASGANSTSFYFVDTSSGAPILTANAAAYQQVSQTETTTTTQFIWTGAGSDRNWATAANWSGGTAPSSTQVAIFDGVSCPTYCSPNIAANLSVGGVRMLAAYTGTITQNTGITITIGTSGWIQFAGTFTGSAASVSFPASNFYLGGGTYTATSGTTTSGGGTIYVASGWTISGSPTFNHNNGTLLFNGVYSTVTVVPGTVIYNNVTSAGTQQDFYLSNTMTVAGNFAMGGAVTNHQGIMMGGQINVAGNVTVTGLGAALTSGAGSGGTIINLNGTTNQSVDASGATTGNIPSLYIANTGGTVSYVGSIQVLEDYKYTSTATTLSAGTSTLTLNTGYSAANYTFNGETYNNLTFYATNATSVFTGTPNVSGKLTFTSATGGAINGGSINASGDVILLGNGFKGTTVVNVAGTSAQKIDASGTTTGDIPTVNITNTGGTVSLFGTIDFNCNWTVGSGVVIAAGTSTVETNFGGNPCTFTPGTSVTYYNVSLLSGNSTAYSIAGSLVASGNVTFGNGSGTVSVSMPNPGASYALTVTGTLTVTLHTTLSLHNATETQGTLVNNGVINL